MQFRLATLLILMTLIALCCGLLFALPEVVALFIITIIVWISPSVWVAGIVAARGRSQAFFIGGTVAGVAPFVVDAYFTMALSISALGNLSTFPLGQSFPSPRLALAAMLFVPGMISCLGGAMSVLTCWLVTPKSTPPSHVPTIFTDRVDMP